MAALAALRATSAFPVRKCYAIVNAVGDGYAQHTSTEETAELKEQPASAHSPKLTGEDSKGNDS